MECKRREQGAGCHDQNFLARSLRAFSHAYRYPPVQENSCGNVCMVMRGRTTVVTSRVCGRPFYFKPQQQELCFPTMNRRPVSPATEEPEEIANQIAVAYAKGQPPRNTVAFQYRSSQLQNLVPGSTTGTRT